MEENHEHDNHNDNHYETPEAETQDPKQLRKIRRTLMYLKRMHDDPAAYRRRFSFRSFIYFMLALVSLLILHFLSDVGLNALEIICLMFFSLCMHWSLLCRMANASLDLNVTIIDWEKVEKLLEEQGE